MHSYPVALAWEFRRRHRWGLALLLIYLAALLIFAAVSARPDMSPERMEILASVAGTAVIPLAGAFMMMLAVFSFGFQADLAGRESVYPVRMFTLPVRSASLAFWPMLYGTATAAALWLFVALVVFRPCGLEVSLVWPALLGAAFVAWTQVLMWLPYPLPWLRAIAAVVLLGALIVSPQLAVHYNVSNAVLVGVLSPLVPLAYLAACVAVGRARRGDMPDWRWWVTRPRRIANDLPPRRSPFSSAACAQVWFEWRRHGRSLPFLVGILLPFALVLQFVADQEMTDIVIGNLVGVLLLPPFMAGFAATTVSKSNPYVRDYYGVPAFTATRPMTSAALVAAKLKMAIWSTLAAWLLLVIAVLLALTLSGNWPVVVKLFKSWLEIESPARVIVIVLLAGCGLIAFTWKQLVQNLYIGLTGREWIIKLSVFATLGFIVILGPIGKWIFDHKQYHARLLDLLPWLAGFAVFLKTAAVFWIVCSLRKHRLLGDRTLMVIGSCWLLGVIALLSVLAWLVPADLVSRTMLFLGTVLLVPLARPAAAPLALEWNRHR